MHIHNQYILKNVHKSLLVFVVITLSLLSCDTSKQNPVGNQKQNIPALFHHQTNRTGNRIGLSHSYDIVIKGHSGTLNVKSEESIGTEFIITLPMQL